MKNHSVLNPLWDTLRRKSAGSVSLGIATVLVLLGGIVIPANCTSGASVTTLITYPSTISVDGGGPLDLVAELNYDNARSNAPIAVVMHGFSGTTGTLGNIQPQARRLRDAGFFSVSVAMRGRDGSDGVRDSGGLEIYDIYDAVEYVKSTYASYVDANNVHITGYSGGGGNAMSALTKFPDYFRLGSGYFGMSDYGYDHTYGWYFYGAGSSHKAILVADIGDPTLGDPAIDAKYAARASRFASANNPYSEIHFFVNYNEPTCPPANDNLYKQNAVDHQSYPGEFNNITVHTGGYGLYEDFNHNDINEPNESQNWPHGFPTANQQHAAEGWYLSRLLAGQIPNPVLNLADVLHIAGYIKTKKFSAWLGTGNNAAGDVNYTLTPDDKIFNLTISTYDTSVPCTLVVDLADQTHPVVVLLNGAVVEAVPEANTYEYQGLHNGDRLELVSGTEPLIEPDTPADLCVWADSNAVFTVVATNPFTGDANGLEYSWYRQSDPCNPLTDGVKYAGSTTSSLTVKNAAGSDEDGYFCRVTLTMNSETSDSRAAILAVRRLLGCWPLDGNAADASGNGNNGTLMNSPSFVAGKVDSNALSLNGTNQYVDVPVSSIMSAISAAKGVSISLWLNGGAGQPSADAVTGACNGTTVVIQTMVPYSNGNVYWDAGNPADGYDRISKAAEPNDYRLQWNFWVFTKDVTAGTMAIYHNGVLWHSGTGKSRSLSGATSLNFGASAGGTTKYYEGLIDDVRIYNYSLSATEVATLYAAVNGPFCISYPIYDFDGDCRVTFKDFAAFAAEWLQCGIPSGCN
jgi:dienelactone hydrolase